MGPDDKHVALQIVELINQGGALHQQNRDNDAVERVDAALVLARKHLSPLNILYGSAVVNAADLHMALRHYQTAERLITDFLAATQTNPAADAELRRAAVDILINLRVRTKDFAGAEEVILAHPANENDVSNFVPQQTNLARIYLATGRRDDARKVLATLTAAVDALPPGYPEQDKLRALVDGLVAHVPSPAITGTQERAPLPPLDDGAFAAATSECRRLFAGHAFAAASRSALELLVRRTTIDLVAIRLVSLRFLGQPLDGAAGRARAVIPKGTLEIALVDFIGGLGTLDAAMDLTSDVQDRCLVLYFAGMLALERRAVDDARDLFTRAAAADPKSWFGVQAAREVEGLGNLARGADALDDNERRRVETAYEAFAAHDYLQFAKLALRLTESHAGTPEVCVLLLAACRATGRDDFASDLAPHVRRQLLFFPWHMRMLDVVLGDAPAHEVLRDARDDVQRCQANYYAAVPFLIAAQWLEAGAYIAAAAASTALCPERHLAQIEGRDVAATVKHVVDMAVLLSQAGRLDQAEQVGRGAVAFARAHAGAGPAPLARALVTLAATVAQRGQLAESLRLNAELAALAPSLPDESRLAVQATLSHVYFEIGAIPEARDIIHRALADPSIAVHHTARAALLNTLGLVEYAVGRPDSALNFHLAALDALEEDGETESMNRAIMEDNAGTALQGLGRHAEALARQERAGKMMATLRDEGGIPETHNSIAFNLANRAWTLLQLGRLEDAESEAKKAAALSLESEHARARVLMVLGCVRWAQGRYAQALDDLLAAAAFSNAVIGDTLALGTNELRMNYAGQARFDMAMLISLASEELIADRTLIERVFDVVLRRKGLAGESAIVQREAVLSRYPSLKPSLDELATVRAEIASMAARGHRQDGAAGLRALQVREQALETSIANAVPELREDAILRDAMLRRVASSVPRNWTIVELVRGPQIAIRPAAPIAADDIRYWAFVVPAGTDPRPHLIALGSAVPIDDAVVRWHSALSMPASAGTDAEKRGLEAGLRLRELVFDPIAHLLPASGHVVVAPDGALARIPFETLPRNDDTFLTDQYTFSYVGTSRDLLRLARGSAPDSGPAIVATNPDYDLGSPPGAADAEVRRFPALPGTAREGVVVGGLLGVAPWTGADVLASRIKALVSPRVLHLATHGFVDDWIDDAAPLRNPLWRSGLALAGANNADHPERLPKEAGDGRLTAADVMGMNLTDTELVVLSACETGLGQVHATEGVMGLRRSFLLAGAKTVIVSLWKIPDELTCALMEDFYKRVLRGVPRSDALTAAQLALRMRHPSPALWGSFICFGAGGALPGAARTRTAANLILVRRDIASPPEA